MIFNDLPPGTEVAVVRADGLPTRAQVAELVEAHRPASPTQYAYFDGMKSDLVAALMALLGEGETDGQ